MKKRHKKISLVALLLLFAASAFIIEAIAFLNNGGLSPRNAVSNRVLANKLNPNHAQALDKASAPLPFEPSRSIKVPILMYHHVGYLPTTTVDSVRIGLTVSPEDFEQQLKWIKAQGHTSISLNDLYSFIQNKTGLPKNPIILTFDDGYKDVFQYAIPILQKYGYSGVFGIITNFPGTSQGTNVYASWDEILAAKNAGMEILCHTQNHFDGSNPKFDANYIFANLGGCQQDMLGHLGLAEPYLIYPYGHYTPVYLAQMKKAGFVMGLTVHEGIWVNPADLFEVPRVRVLHNETMETFEKKLQGLPL